MPKRNGLTATFLLLLCWAATTAQAAPTLAPSWVYGFPANPGQAYQLRAQ